MACADPRDYRGTYGSAGRFFYNEPGFEITNARDVDGICYKNERVRWHDGCPMQTSLDLLEEHSQSLLTAVSVLTSPPFFFMCTRSAFRPSEVQFLPLDEVAAWLEVFFQKGFRFHSIEPLTRRSGCEMKACLIAYLQCADVSVFLSEEPCAPALPLVPRAPQRASEGNLNAGMPGFAIPALPPSPIPSLPAVAKPAPRKPAPSVKAAKPSKPKPKKEGTKKAPKKTPAAALKAETVSAAAALQNISAATDTPRRTLAPPKAVESLWKRQRVSPAPPSREFPLAPPPRKLDAPQKRARKADTTPLSVLAPKAVIAKAPRAPRKERAARADDIEMKESCVKCGMSAKDTPMMRKGPDGCRSMCNACGLRWVRHGIC